MAGKGERFLLPKQPLLAPETKAVVASYVQERASKNEITIVRGKAKKITRRSSPILPCNGIGLIVILAVEWSSQEAPSPFLDPSIIQRRIAAEKQWKPENSKSS
jgi:hypothetical protein